MNETALWLLLTIVFATGCSATAVPAPTEGDGTDDPQATGSVADSGAARDSGGARDSAMTADLSTPEVTPTVSIDAMPDPAIDAAAPAEASRPEKLDGPLASDAAPAAFVNVITNRYGNRRLGWNSGETLLTPQTVGSGKFGKLFARRVDGQIHAQPLYMAGLDIPGKGVQNVVFVATGANKVYAFNADDGAKVAPLWEADFGASGASAGITATPAIEPSTKTIYVVSKQQENSAWVQRLHALDLATGKERPGSPIVIRSAFAGTGAGSVGGMISFDPQRAEARAGLLLVPDNNIPYLYIAFGSPAGTSPSHGWVLRYDTVTLKQVANFVTTPNGDGGNIGMSGAGMAEHPAGFLYVTTGTGDAQPGSKEFTSTGKLAQSIVVLSLAHGHLGFRDYFLPANYADLNAAGTDFGTSGVLVLPKLDYIITGSGAGPGYFMYAYSLGQYGPNDQKVQKLVGSGDNTLVGKAQYGGFVYWEGPAGGVLYTWPENQRLLGFKVKTTGVEKDPSYVGPVTAGARGGDLTISSNGAKDGVVWTYVEPGILRAFDATSLAKEIWSSETIKMRDEPGTKARFAAPMVANGKVYVPTWSGELAVYGLLH